MRIVYLTNIPSPYRVDFFNELGKYCHLTVLYEMQKASDRDERWDSETIHENYTAVFLKGKECSADSAFCLGVTKWLNRENFDLFIIGGYSTPTGMLAIQMLKLRKIPFILNSDGGFVKNDNKLKFWIKKYFISRASWWLSTGEKTNEYLENYGAKKENVFVYPFTSIRESEILLKPITIQQKRKLREELRIEGEKVALSVGQLIPRKGYDTLIKSWGKVDASYKLVIVGSGPQKEELENLIETNNCTNIQLIDFKTKKELIKYYRAADIFVLPTREDIWGLVINEAIANGLPVITTDGCIAGMEIIKEKYNGSIIPIDDSDYLTATINKYLNLDNNQIEEYGTNSIVAIQQYTIENMAKVHCRILTKIHQELKR